MSVPIGGMPTAPELRSTHLLVVEECENNVSIETQKTTLGNIYNWLNSSLSNTFNIKTNQILTDGSNLTKSVDNVNNTITIGYKIPEWETGTYIKDTVVKYEDNLYISLADTNAPPTNAEYWQRIGYKIGQHLYLTDNNTLSGEGIDNWTANTEYSINDFVIYNKRLYQCVIANNDSEWNKEHWLNIGEGNGILIYENGKTYEADAIVIYENRLYKRLTTGADINWTSNNWLCISNGDYAQTFIKYSHVMPTANSDMKDTPDEYIGIYVGKSETAPTTYSAYTWYKFRGDNGYVNIDSSVIVITMQLLATDWIGEGPYTQTIQNASLTATMYPIMDIYYSEDSSKWEAELRAYENIIRYEVTDGAAIFYCLDKPPVTFGVKLRINGDVNANSFVTKQEFNEFKDSIGDINQLLEETLGGN